MPIYERGSGQYTAERVRPVPGGEDEQRYEALAADPDSGWRRVGEAPAAAGEGSGSGSDGDKPPTRSASKADWVAYAVTRGMDEAEADKGYTRDQLAALYLDGGDPNGNVE